MSRPLNRRQFLQASAACVAAVAGAKTLGAERSSPGKLVLNDDGHVFPYLTDNLHKADLRRYLRS